MLSRQAIGGAIGLGIVLGLGINTWLTAHPIKVVYAAEPVERVVQIEVVIDWTPERIEREIQEKAEQYGVSASEMKRVIKCESQGSTTVQSRHRRPDGSRERSFGLAQWHIPSGNVAVDGRVFTEEMAKNPAIAIENMAWYFSRGLQEKWSCW